MSVAFRRDGDEEHLEPVFDIPIAPGPNLVTPRGLALIEAQVAALEEAAAAADAATRPALLRDLRYWQTRRVTAEVVTCADDGTVQFGSRVVFRLGGRERTLRIVGGDEADPAAGSIGFQAPLARALIGASAGERIDFGGAAGAIAVMAVS